MGRARPSSEKSAASLPEELPGCKSRGNGKAFAESATRIGSMLQLGARGWGW